MAKGRNTTALAAPSCWRCAASTRYGSEPLLEAVIVLRHTTNVVEDDVVDLDVLEAGRFGFGFAFGDRDASDVGVSRH